LQRECEARNGVFCARGDAGLGGPTGLSADCLFHPRQSGYVPMPGIKWRGTYFCSVVAKDPGVKSSHRKPWSVPGCAAGCAAIKATLHMGVLRCLTPAMIRKEISVHMLAYNLVRWAMVCAAYLGEVLPRLLSFAGARRVLGAFANQLRQCPGRRLRIMFAAVLGAMASLRLPSRPRSRGAAREKKTTEKPSTSDRPKAHGKNPYP